jgi:TonB family protein
VSDYAVGGGAAHGFAGQGYGMNKSAMRSMAPVAADGLMETEAKLAPPPPTGAVKVGKVEIQGGLPERAVKQPVEKQLFELVNAYSAELAAQPGLRGKMVVEFTVGTDGLVRDVKVVLNEVTPSLEPTALQMLQKLTISNSTGGDATVKVTFNFRP